MGKIIQLTALSLFFLTVGCGRGEFESPTVAIDSLSKNAESKASGVDDKDVATEIDSADAIDGSGTESVDADFQKTEYATPQECFAAWQQASKANDVAAVLGCLADWDRYQRVGWYAYYLDREILYGRDNAEAAKKLLSNYDIHVGTVMEYIHQGSNAPPVEMAKLVSKIGRQISQPSQFAVEASKLVEITMGGKPPQPEQMTLADLKIQSDVAAGILKMTKKGQPERIYFKRFGNRWLITTKP